MSFTRSFHKLYAPANIIRLYCTYSNTLAHAFYQASQNGARCRIILDIVSRSGFFSIFTIDCRGHRRSNHPYWVVFLPSRIGDGRVEGVRIGRSQPLTTVEARQMETRV